MLEYLSINQCQCCEVVVVVFIYSHPAYRVCWHKAFIYLYGCTWLVENHTQRKRKTYTTSVNQWIKLMLEVNSTGSRRNSWYTVSSWTNLPLAFYKVPWNENFIQDSWQKHKRPCVVIRASLAKSCLMIVLFFLRFCPAHLHLCCVLYWLDTST